MRPVDVPQYGGLLAHRVCDRLAGRAEGLAAPTEIQNNSGLPQAFVYLFTAIRCRPVACVLCWQNKELLSHRVRVGSPSATNSVATALRRTEQKRGSKNGFWLRTNARNGVAHTSFNRGLAAGGDPVSGVRSALHRAGGPRGAEW